MNKPKASGIVNWVLLLILATAAIVRLWRFWEIPFTYDEFSALFRTQFSGFSEMIAHGARVDGHPAGIQTFLYFYVQIVGFNEALIKLPFIASGIAAVYLTYKIGKEWFSENTGLLAATTMAILHYTIVYSQIARPYSSGLFFTLLMLLGWSRLTLTGIGKKRNQYIYFILGGALCLYNHHFSGLMVVLASIYGLFLLRGKNLKHYMFACAAIVVLYLPHIEIFFHQLSLGGIGQWLNKPDAVFFVDYVRYIFHFSPPTFALFAGMMAFGLFISIAKKQFRFKKTHIAALFLGLTPAITGFFYSVYVAPLLQFSILLFSFPLLLILAFSVFEPVKRIHTLFFIAGWSLMLLYSLIFIRQHYHFFYRYPYQEAMKEIKAFTDDHSADSTLVLCNFRPEITQFYQHKYQLPAELCFVNPDSVQDLNQMHFLLAEKHFKYLILAKTHEKQPWLHAYVQEYFPAELSSELFNQGCMTIFRRGKQKTAINEYESRCHFASNDMNEWIYNQDDVLTDTLGSSRMIMLDSNTEFSTTHVVNLNDHLAHKASVIDAVIWCYVPEKSIGEVLWVLSIESDTGSYCWYATPIRPDQFPKNEWAPVAVSIHVPDLPNIQENSILKVYLKSESNSSFFFRDASLVIRKGNSAVYWITYGIL